MNFFQFADDLKKYPSSNFIDDLVISLDESEEATNLQISQWQDGRDSNGQTLGYYKPLTEILSGGRKKAGELYNLNDSGDLYKQTSLWSRQSGIDVLFHFDSLSKNKEKLFRTLRRESNDTYDPENIFGLQPKNKERLTAIAVEKAIQILNTNLKLI
jgi:hypothetical protein